MSTGRGDHEIVTSFRLQIPMIVAILHRLCGSITSVVRSVCWSVGGGAMQPTTASRQRVFPKQYFL